MLKTKLPVIVLRNLILLPHGEIKLEIYNEADIKIINNSINNHDSYLLLVSPNCYSEEEINIDDLPKIGIIGKITNSFELPNSHIRISITGVNRANIFKYINEDEASLSSIIGPYKLQE